MSERQFPILRNFRFRYPVDAPTSLPWSLIEPHRQAAERQHGQTLERLAQRGGLSCAELWFILQDKSWGYDRTTDDDKFPTEAEGLELVLQRLKGV